MTAPDRIAQTLKKNPCQPGASTYDNAAGSVINVAKRAKWTQQAAGTQIDGKLLKKYSFVPN